MLKFLKLLKPINLDEIYDCGFGTGVLIVISYITLALIWFILSIGIVLFKINPTEIRIIFVLAITYAATTITVNKNIKEKE